MEGGQGRHGVITNNDLISGGMRTDACGGKIHRVEWRGKKKRKIDTPRKRGSSGKVDGTAKMGEQVRGGQAWPPLRCGGLSKRKKRNQREWGKKEKGALGTPWDSFGG